MTTATGYVNAKSTAHIAVSSVITEESNMTKFPKSKTKIGKHTEFVIINVGDAKLRVPKHRAKNLKRRLGYGYKIQQRSHTVGNWDLITHA